MSAETKFGLCETETEETAKAGTCCLAPAQDYMVGLWPVSWFEDWVVNSELVMI